jgi:Cation transporter/ATPase, N-terminus
MNTATGVGESWHQMATMHALDALESSPQGLSTAEAHRRLDAYGPDVLGQGQRRRPVSLPLAQCTDLHAPQAPPQMLLEAA